MVVDRQLANCSWAVVTPWRRAIRKRASPDNTVCATQPAGGPQAVSVGISGGVADGEELGETAGEGVDVGGGVGVKVRTGDR